MLTWNQELHETWIAECDHLNEMEKGDPGYDMQMERVSNLEKLLCDLEKSTWENDVKWSQIEESKKSRWTKLGSDIFGTAAPLAVALAMGLFSMKWEDLHMMSTTAGKASLRDLFRFRK